MSSAKARRVLPGFGLSLGFTLVVSVADRADPAVGGVHQERGARPGRSSGTWSTTPRVVASYRLTFGASLLAAAINAVFGLHAGLGAGALQLSRASRIVDALVDLPFALPTAVAGIALTALYAPATAGSASIWSRSASRSPSRRSGVLVALVFIGLPFVVRTVQPVLEDLDAELEEAAASLGAHALADLPPRACCRCCCRRC